MNVNSAPLRRPGLNVLDDYCREALGIETDYSLPAKRVTRLLDRLVTERGKPQRLRSDNGPEFISDELQRWCKTNGVELHWIEPLRRTVWQTDTKCLHRAI